jgi:D-alanyl-D-alanine carboxypeptidase
MVRLLCVLVAVGLAAALLAGAARFFSAGSGQGDTVRPEKVLLVSATHPLPKDYRPPELVRLVGELPVSTNKVRVAARIETPLVHLFAAAKDAGISGLYVISGYRSPDEQRKLWAAAKDKSYVQRPGRSEHQTGLAVDLGQLGVRDHDLADNSAGQWLAQNSWRYGFILRYPPDKRAITGISYEPWHFRYVGDGVAQACHRDGLVLEEYLAGGS